MDDSISRKAAIIQLSHNKTGDDDCDVIVQKDIETIKLLPSAQPEQRWIPCSERMPPKSGEYIVSGRWAGGKVAVGSCEYSKADGYFQTAWTFDVLAWMSLPEPWRGEQDG